MVNFELIKGRGYQMSPDTYGLPNDKIYVMSQFLPKTGEEWETFFSLLGGKNLWAIFRTRIPKSSIISLEGSLITLSEKPVVKHVWPDEPDRKSLVAEWLNEVKPILEKRRYRNTESFKDYFSRLNL